MEILGSAFKRGVSAEQIRQALQVPMRTINQEPVSGEAKALVIGADNAARLLELIVVDGQGDRPRVIHAMPLRAAFYKFL